MKCLNCNNEHAGNYGSGVYCSVSCARKRTHTKESKEKISNSLKKDNFVLKNCLFCKKEISVPYNKRNRKFCSRSCTSKYNITSEVARALGIASSQKRVRRSKNEIYFYELCLKEFKNIENNVSIFNGWDADIIIHDVKIAVLWNGKWHYEKICKSHSLLQVQNRDDIKIKEIINFGYSPYVIKDMGRYDKLFVEQAFKNFMASIPSHS